MDSFTGVRCYNCRQENSDMWIVSTCQHCLCCNCLSNQEAIKDCDACKAETVLKCINGSEGCGVKVFRDRVDSLSDHLRICQYKKIPCPNHCPEKVSKRDLIKHVSNECRKRILECSHCHDTLFAYEMETHVTRCDLVLVKCDFCDQQTLRKEMENHLRDCSLAEWPCEWSNFGCEFKGTLEELQKHAVLNTHPKLIGDYMRRSEEGMKMLKEDLRVVQGEVQTLKQNLQSSENILREYKNTVQNLEDENKSLQQDIMRIKQELQCCSDEVKTLGKTITNGENNIKDFKKQNEALEVKLTVLDDSMSQLVKAKKDLEHRLKAYKMEEETGREELLKFRKKFRKELLQGLKAGYVNPEGMKNTDALLSCLNLIKDWAVGIKHLQEIIISREDIDLTSSHNALPIIKMNLCDDLTMNTIFNLGIEQIPMFSRTFILGPTRSASRRAIISHESVHAVIRLKFMVRGEEVEVFAEVSRSKVKSVRVVIQLSFTKSVVLDVTLADLATRVTKVPIFCGTIPRAVLPCIAVYDIHFETVPYEHKVNS